MSYGYLHGPDVAEDGTVPGSGPRPAEPTLHVLLLSCVHSNLTFVGSASQCDLHYVNLFAYVGGRRRSRLPEAGCRTLGIKWNYSTTPRPSTLKKADAAAVLPAAVEFITTCTPDISPAGPTYDFTRSSREPSVARSQVFGAVEPRRMLIGDASSSCQDCSV